MQRQILEIRLADAEQAQHYQDTFSRLYQREIVPLLDRACSELSGPDQLYRIESLEVDLGSIDPARFEAEVMARVGPALHRALAEQLRNAEQSNVRQPAMRQTAAHLELLTTYARTGNLPWWADAADPHLLEACLSDLLATAPQALHRQLAVQLQDGRARQRLAASVADPQLADLAQLLNPGLAGALRQLPQELARLLHAAGLAAAASAARLRQIAWSHLLLMAAPESASLAELAPVLRVVLQRISRDLGRPYRGLLADLYPVLEAGRAGGSSPLRDALTTLYWADAAASGSTGQTAAEIAQRLTRRQAAGGALAALWDTLSALAPHLTAAQQAELADALAADTPASVRRILRLLSGALAAGRFSAIDRDALAAALTGPAATALAQDAPAELAALQAQLPVDAGAAAAAEPLTAMLAQSLTQRQAAGGALAAFWEALLALAPHLTAAQQAELADALAADTPASVRRILRLLSGALAAGRLSATDRDALAAALTGPAAAVLAQHAPAKLAALQAQLPVDAGAAAAAEPLTATLAQSLTQRQAAGGALAAFWEALLALAPHLTAAQQAELADALAADTPASVRRILRLLSGALATGRFSAIDRDALAAALTGPAATVLAQDAPAELAHLHAALDELETPAAAEEAMQDLSSSPLDELYIANAGLVILWPFLEGFCTRLGLLAERRFIDGAAAQRAVGLLQVAASGERDFPEYLLPLNKVLCGMEPTDLFALEPPLTDEEAEECDDLLRAVVVQAPILRDMTVAGLRGSFLLRQGVLRTRDGAWLLQVERASYDVVLDRFPWSWQWVRLPWMDAPLRVEWL